MNPAASTGAGKAVGAPRVLAASEQPLAAAYDVALVDLDGVVYLGPRPVPGAAEALAAARATGMRLAFVTNNSSRPVDAVLAHLAELGVPATADDVVTSAQAAATLVSERLGTGARVLAVGGAGLRAALEAAGCELVDSADDKPDAVVQGYAADLRYADLAEAALAVERGAWWVATNRDPTLPSDRGVLPGNGALVDAVAAAVGRRPEVYAGKPDPALLGEAIRRTGAERPLMVGDRLDTDIEGAVVAGIDSLCVLTGVHSGADLLTAPQERRPTYVGIELTALVSPHAAPERTDDRSWRCGAWEAVVDGSMLRVRPREPRTSATGPADRAADDLLRAAAAAAWATSDAGEAPSSIRVDPAGRDLARAAGLDRLLAPPGRDVR